MKKVSVIIPMYNSQSFIKECMQSVVRQSYPNWEMIVVDDGSSDKSVEICSKLSRADGRIRIVCQKHLGVSAARNRGIEEAAGEFLLFLDSDDEMHPLLIEKFVYLAEKYHAELVMCQCRKVNTYELERGLEKTDTNAGRLKGKVGNGRETEEWFHVRYARQMAGIGGKMIRKSAVGELRFDEGLGNGEDTLFLYHLSGSKIRTVYLYREWYYYRIHPGNTVNSFQTKNNMGYFECSRTIRDKEYRMGRIRYALTWERMFVIQIESSYTEAKKVKDLNKCQRLREIANKETRFLLLKKLEIFHKLMFWSCFYFFPLYVLLRKILIKLWEE